jgi:hypothetical protein
MMMVLVSVMILGTISCGKYEEGPGFSLATKKARLTGDWKIDKYDGALVTTPWTKTFNSDGIYKETLVINDIPVSYEGKWQFVDNKEVVQVELAGAYGKHIIVKLTASEFWYRDTNDKLWELKKQ